MLKFEKKKNENEKRLANIELVRLYGEYVPRSFFFIYFQHAKELDESVYTINTILMGLLDNMVKCDVKNELNNTIWMFHDGVGGKERNRNRLCHADIMYVSV